VMARRVSFAAARRSSRRMRSWDAQVPLTRSPEPNLLDEWYGSRSRSRQRADGGAHVEGRRHEDDELDAEQHRAVLGQPPTMAPATFAPNARSAPRRG